MRENSPISRSQISKKLNISAPAVSRVIEKLISEDFAIESEKLITPSGKRPTLIKLNQNKGYIIGVDLGKEKFTLALTNFSGEIIDEYQGFKIIDEKNIPEKIIKEVKYFLSRNNKIKELNLNRIKAMCVGVPAIIDYDTGKIVNAPLYSSWKDINLKEYLSNKLDIPIFIENDVNLSALGEKYFGQGKKFKDLIFINVSNGIGAGIIIDNHLFRGSYGCAGEIGFTIINSNNLDFKAKNKGLLEEFASTESLAKKAIIEIIKEKKTIITKLINGKIGKLEPSVVCKAAIEGDCIANKIISENVSLLSIGIVNLILIQNPQVIILGGDICNLPGKERLFLNPIIERIKNSIPFNIPEIKFSSLGGDAGIIGSTFFAIEALVMDEFPYRIERELLI
ncbi:MAG: ROK family transcriptional regulator [Cyanobacteria bacterium]|nr:ROK family transcriptional regulator [Cyanobacteriota bacterium]